MGNFERYLSLWVALCIVAGIGLVQWSTLVFVFAFLLGAAQIVLAQNALISVHSATPDDLRGRVMGIWVMTFQGSSLFGSFLSGWLADLLGVRTAMLAGALALALIGVAALLATACGGDDDDADATTTTTTLATATTTTTVAATTS